MKYEEYEYYFNRAGLVRNVGVKISTAEYSSLTEEQRNNEL